MATKPDVRIRLSAEGVQEVVNALKTVQTQAAKSQKEAADANRTFGASADSLRGSINNLRAAATGDFSAVSGAVGGLRASFVGLTGAVGLAGVALAAFSLKAASETGDRLLWLSKRTGDTVESLSAIEYAGKRSNLSLDETDRAILKLTDSMGKAAKGTGDEAAALKVLGITLRGQKPAQLMLEIADALGKYEDGANKTRIATVLLGDRGTELTSNLRELTGQAADAGRVLSTEAAQAAAGFKGQIDDLLTSVGELSVQLGGRLATMLNQVINRFDNAREAGQDFFRAMFTAATGGGKTLQDALDLNLKEQAEVQRRIGLITSGELSRSAKGFDEMMVARENKTLTELRRRASDIQARLAEQAALAGNTKGPRSGLPQAPAIPGGGGAGSADRDAQAIFKARIAEARAQAKREYDLEVESLRAKQQANQRAYEDGELDLKSYHNVRMNLLNEQQAAELAYAQNRLASAEALKTATEADRVTRQTAIDDTKAEIALIKTRQELASKDERAKQAKELVAQERLLDQVEDQLATSIEKRSVAMRRAMELELKRTEELLVAQGVSIDKRNELLTKLRESREFDIRRQVGQEGLDSETRRFNEQTRRIEQRRAELDQQVGRGEIFGLEGAERLLEYQKAQLPVLREMAQTLGEMIDQVGEDDLPQFVTQLDAVNAAIRDIELSADVVGQAMARVRETLTSSISDGFNNFFDNIISGSMKGKDAVRQFAFDVVDNLRKIAQELLIQQALRSFFGGMGGGAGGFFGTLFGGQGFAEGGYVSGAGTGTSDSIPARLSNGEFVVRAAAVSQPGVLSMLQAINGGMTVNSAARDTRGIARFADGGLVSAPASGGAVDGRVEIGLDPGLVLKTLKSASGQLAVVEAVSKRRQAVRNLGI